jgi:hypothetical protein
MSEPRSNAFISGYSSLIWKAGHCTAPSVRSPDWPLNVEREVHIICIAAVHEPVIIFALQEGLAGAIYGYN